MSDDDAVAGPVGGPLVLDGLDAVRASVGTGLGPTEWVEVTPERLAAFAAVCPGVDVGWLLLSMTNLFMPEMVEVRGVSAGLNLGTGAIRFATDGVGAGTRVRGRGRVVAADDAKGGVQTTIELRVEADGTATPVVTAESLSRWLE